MIIQSANYLISSPDYTKCPKADRPEYAFIGRSNVGKSSLINMLCDNHKLAKISKSPGKTQMINHFDIKSLPSTSSGGGAVTPWYLVDLPGYGYASVSKSLRFGFGKMIEEYILKRENLDCLFILLDSRLEPQSIDLSFIEWAGAKEIPICLVLTKTDKLKQNQLQQNKTRIENKLLEMWEELPPIIVTSSTAKKGKKELLDFIKTALVNQKQN